MAINTIGGNTLLVAGSFPPARVASTGSPLTPTTGGLLVVDGIQLVAGDRVLCKDETSAVDNGIYAANTGPWVRTSDAATNSQFFSGMGITVALGATNGGKTFLCTTSDDPVVVGTSNIVFAAQNVVITASIIINAGLINQLAYYASAGSALSGLATANNGTLITDGSGVPSISSTLPSAVQGNITRTGTVVSGTWQGTTIGVGFGGTGVTSSTGSGSLVLSNAPTLVAPTLGVATATTINNVALTQPAGGSTLTIANGKTLTVSKSLTLAGTDGTTLTFQATDTYVGRGTTDVLTNKTLTSPVIASISGNSGATGTLSTGTNGGTGGQLTFNGATSGSAAISVSATAGTLSIGSANFTVDSSGNLLENGVVSILRGTPIPAGGTAGIGYSFSSTANFGIFFGSSTPTLTAAKGSFYFRSDGTTSTTRAYINTDSSSNWTAITTVA